MNTFLIIAVAILLVTVFAHSILGEIKVLSKMDRKNLLNINGIPKMWSTDAFTYRTMRFVWHIPSVFGIGMAIIIFNLAKTTDPGTDEIFTLKVIGGSMLISGLITLLISKGSHMGWILFFATAVFIYLGIAT